MIADKLNATQIEHLNLLSVWNKWKTDQTQSLAELFNEHIHLERDVKVVLSGMEIENNLPTDWTGAEALATAVWAWSQHDRDMTLGEYVEDVVQIDTKTSLPMVDGWCFFGGEAYFQNEGDAERYCQERCGCTIQELYDDPEDSDAVYWTEWYNQ